MNSADKTYKETLIKALKKEVKQIMEEAVTKKFVHEDSASITSLCAAVEACVSHGLQRRALGLFKSSSTSSALLHKVAKSFQPAATIVQMVFETESCDSNKRSSSGSESASKLIGAKPPLQKRNSQAGARYVWIRFALLQKVLDKIIDYIVKNSSKYYEKYALVSDADYGTILSSLLMGPCALDFSRLRSVEHLWSDPPADELVQRHRISSGHVPSPPVVNRPSLHYKGSTGFNSDDTQRSKDYVESLHQNNKSTLLYGKNNVLVLLKDFREPLAGYLSLHQCGEMLNLKWTPNHLMNGSSNEQACVEKSLYWDYALNLVVHEIVYVHCHQDQERDWIVLVGQDGVQRPPIHFPRGGHLLAFLSCLENGLMPHGILDPPLQSQTGTGKVFPKLRRKGSRLKNGKDVVTMEEEVGQEGNAADFVFRIVYSSFNQECPQKEMLEDNLWKSLSSTKSVLPATPRSTPIHSISTTSSTSSSKSLDQQIFFQEPSEPMQVVCQTMKRQIISRAFYGWLAHCRHLRTVRTHLVGLVQPEILKPEENDASGPLTESRWKELRRSESFTMTDLYKIVYFNGVSQSLRRELWPLLLAGNMEGENVEELRRDYENQMSEWLAVEAIVQQRDKENMAANMAKLSSESVTGERSPGPLHLQHGSNEVFEDDVGSETTVDTEGANNADSVVQNEKSTPTSKKRLSNDQKFDISDKFNSSSIDKPNGYANPVRNVSVSSDDSARSSKGGQYTNELIETFGLNVHRIDKDVKRCDRNYWYFTESNLDKLRNLMCTYVWENMEIGYVQGMCDLAAPLLVIMDDEAVAYGCFRCLMQRMAANFPSGGDAMDSNFANMRSLLQVLDNDLFSLIRQNGDYTHFYFCYRWFLLDFKREFCYDDVFRVWETIWAARHVSSTDFVLFVALALLSYYRDIILSNSMDFTDIIKFFNEMAEHHDVNVILRIARNLVVELQTLIENK